MGFSEDVKSSRGNANSEEMQSKVVRVVIVSHKNYIKEKFSCLSLSNPQIL